MRGFLFILLLILLLSQTKVCAQGPELSKERQIESVIESYSETEEAATDNNVELDDLTKFSNRPLNINTATEEELQKLVFLNFAQVSNIIAYRKANGQFFTTYELSAIDGLDETTIRKITPFIIFGNEADSTKVLSLSRLNQRLYLRAKTVFPEGKGYASVDSEKPAAYSGSPLGYYVRYKAEVSGKLEFGLTADKDAGEDFFSGKNKRGFDYYSGHIAWFGKGWLQQINLGDYHLRFGQGLNFWTGSGVNKSVEALNIMRSGQGIRAYSSADENAFFRGGAITLGDRSAKLSLFYSNKNRDANTETGDTGKMVFTSLQTSGLHRTNSEKDDEKSVNEIVAGMNGELRFSKFKLGVTGVYQRFNLPMTKGTSLYKAKSFEGIENFNFGIDYQMALRRLQLFGETGISLNMKAAIVQGAVWHLHPQLGLSFYYRNFDEGFHTFYGNALSESSGNRNESGFYIGFEILPIKKVRITGYIDVYHFPWITYSTTSPASGNDLMVQLNYSMNRKLFLYFRLKTETKPQKESGNIGVPSDYNETIGKFRIHADWQLSDKLTLRSRLEYADYAFKSNTETGYLFFQDFVYSPRNDLTFWFRYAYYQTDGYNTRIYAYENDLLYYYAVPAFYGKGTRIYLNLQWQPTQTMTFYFKSGYSLRKDVDSIGSGYDETAGNQRLELRAQLYVRF